MANSMKSNLTKTGMLPQEKKVRDKAAKKTGKAAADPMAKRKAAVAKSGKKSKK